MIVHSAPMGDIDFLAHEVRKSENFPRYLEYNGGNFKIDLENVFLIRFSARLPTFRFVLRQNFFFSRKNTKGQSLCTFSVKFFKFESGRFRTSKGVSMIVHSAPMRDIASSVHRVGKSENFPRYLEYNCGNFKIDLKNVFLIRFSARLPTFRFVLRQNFFFLEKTPKANPFALFR